MREKVGKRRGDDREKIGWEKKVKRMRGEGHGREKRVVRKDGWVRLHGREREREKESEREEHVWNHSKKFHQSVNFLCLCMHDSSIYEIDVKKCPWKCQFGHCQYVHDLQYEWHVMSCDYLFNVSL